MGIYNTHPLQLTSHLEASPAAFYIVSGSVTALAMLVFAYGLRVLRRVRRVGLSRSTGPSRTALAIGENTQLDSTIARRIVQDDNPPLKWSIWSAIFKRQAKRDAAATSPVADPLKAKAIGSSTPLWINEKADLARARDAVHHAEMQKAKEAATGRRLREAARWKQASLPTPGVRKLWPKE